MIKKVLVFSCLICFANTLFSANIEWKSGYAVKTNGDTIRGIMAFRGYANGWESCHFKENITDSVEVFGPGDLQLYNYDSGVRFESKTIPLSNDTITCFVECLVKGIVSLYYLQVGSTSGIDRVGVYSFFAETASGRIVELPVPDYEEAPGKVKFRNGKILIWLFGQHPEMGNSIQRVSYDRKSMIKIFQKYHDLVCTDYSCVVYLEKPKKKRYYLTPWIGGSLQHYRADGYNSESLRGVRCSPSAGVTFSMTLNGFTDRFLLNIGLNISSININYIYDKYYDAKFSQVLNSVTYEHLNFKSVQFVNFYSVDYRLMNYKMVPVFEIGLLHGCNIPINNRYDVRYWSQDKSKVMESSLSYWGNRYYVGILAGAGCIIPLQKGTLPVRLQYQCPLVPNLDGYRLIYNSLVLSVGYTFKL